MRYAFSLTIAGTLLAQGTSALWLLPQARNFIYIVPDGFGPASQTMARDYVSLLQNGENPKAPVSIQLPADGHWKRTHFGERQPHHGLCG
jgi:alkaline phosphatase